MINKEWSAESNYKLPHLFIPNKTATLAPEFAVKDLPLGRTAAMVPAFAVKDLTLDRTLMKMIRVVMFVQLLVMLTQYLL